ncbi:tetratricopeptide repeat domain protein, partial [Colletotrichum sublineola]
LELSKKVLGLENPSTLTSMSNLVLVFDSQGRHDEAEQMHRQTLEMREKVLGPNCPLTLNIRHDLAASLEAWTDSSSAARIG